MKKRQNIKEIVIIIIAVLSGLVIVLGYSYFEKEGAPYKTEYSDLIATKKITAEQILALKKGLSYREIVYQLGNTKDIGSGLHVLQYVVGEDQIFYLSFANENDICYKSGAELLATVEDVNDYKGKDKNTFRATLMQRNGNSIFVSCPTYDGFDSIYLSITKATIIIYDNGTKATIEDIKGKLTITIGDQIMESYPPQGTALKIVIDS